MKLFSLIKIPDNEYYWKYFIQLLTNIHLYILTSQLIYSKYFYWLFTLNIFIFTSYPQVHFIYLVLNCLQVNLLICRTINTDVKFYLIYVPKICFIRNINIRQRHNEIPYPSNLILGIESIIQCWIANWFG